MKQQSDGFYEITIVLPKWYSQNNQQQLTVLACIVETFKSGTENRLQVPIDTHMPNCSTSFEIFMIYSQLYTANN